MSEGMPQETCMRVVLISEQELYLAKVPYDDLVRMHGILPWYPYSHEQHE